MNAPIVARRIRQLLFLALFLYIAITMLWTWYDMRQVEKELALETARSDTSVVMMDISLDVGPYRKANDSFPQSLRQLTDWRTQQSQDPYEGQLPNGEVADAWGNPLRLKIDPEQNIFIVQSNGPNGLPNDEDDLIRDFSIFHDTFHEEILKTIQQILDKSKKDETE